MSYVTQSEYAQITGDSMQEATTARIKRASRLLDMRVGNWKRSGEFKLTLSDLEEWQSVAVKDWVAWMIYALVQNNDAVQVNESVKLGRFSVTARGNSQVMFPDELAYADYVLKDSGMIKLGLNYTNSPTTSTVVNE